MRQATSGSTAGPAGGTAVRHPAIALPLKRISARLRDSMRQARDARPSGCPQVESASCTGLLQRDGGDGMPDYKGMYLAMLRASESAIETLIGAQRACEEQYLSADETPVELLPKQPDDR